MWGCAAVGFHWSEDVLGWVCVEVGCAGVLGWDMRELVKWAEPATYKFSRYLTVKQLHMCTN